MKLKIVLLFLISLNLFSCEESHIPKKRAYYRLETPTLEYKNIEAPQFYLDILKSSQFGMRKDNVDWSTIEYPTLNAALYLSYFKDTNIEKLTEDARKSAYKHTIKADDIINMQFALPEKNLYGTVYSIEGNAATPAIFFFTDSVQQFLHGTVYFNCSPNADSLKPVIQFIRQDIEHIIETFEWKDSEQKSN